MNRLIPYQNSLNFGSKLLNSKKKFYKNHICTYFIEKYERKMRIKSRTQAFKKIIKKIKVEPELLINCFDSNPNSIN